MIGQPAIGKQVCQRMENVVRAHAQGVMGVLAEGAKRCVHSARPVDSFKSYS